MKKSEVRELARCYVQSQLISAIADTAEQSRRFNAGYHAGICKALSIGGVGPQEQYGLFETTSKYRVLADLPCKTGRCAVGCNGCSDTVCAKLAAVALDVWPVAEYDEFVEAVREIAEGVTG